MITRHSDDSESEQRLYEKLYQDLEGIIEFLEDPEVLEIMLNPDGKLWIEVLNQGLVWVKTLSSAQAFSIIHGLAGIHQFVITERCPRLETEFPVFRSLKGERFTAQIPPLVTAPCFTVRKRVETRLTLEDYVLTGRLTSYQADILRNYVLERKNLLVCGGPGSGKTTLTNALIQEAVQGDPNQRFILLEDVRELQCSALNVVSMLTSHDIDMRGLLRSAMRMRPDRILIGEVRGAEALDMLKAWNTGCPGGIGTVHANGPEEAIQRILDLSMESGLTLPPISLVRYTIDAVIFVVSTAEEKETKKEQEGQKDQKNKKNKKGFVESIFALKSNNEGRDGIKKSRKGKKVETVQEMRNINKGEIDEYEKVHLERMA